MEERFFRFLGETAVEAMVGLCLGKRPRIRIRLEWEDDQQRRQEKNYSSRHKRTGSDAGTRTTSTENKVWGETVDQ